MKKIISLVLFFWCQLSFCQSHIIVDSITKEPIPFVAIKYVKSQSGFYSTEKGFFKLENEKYDSLQISCMGYKTIFKSSNSLNDSIFLVPESTKLKEVILNELEEKKEKIYLKRKKIRFYINPRLQIGLLIKPQKRHVGKYIDNIIIPINKKLAGKTKGDKSFKSVFKVNIYTNELGLPKYTMLEKPLDIFVTNSSKNLISIDLSDNLIDFPKEGIFICIEMIGEINDEGKVIETKNPRPSFVFTDKQIKEFTSKSYFKTKFNDVWQLMSMETFHLEKEIFLAIGLTLSSYE